MSKTYFEIKETAVANFQTALNNAGMQRSSGTEVKPKYWRGRADNIDQDLFLVFTVTDNMEIEACDNESLRRIVYINGEIYTRSGANDSNYQDLANNIEKSCKALDINIVFSDDGIDSSIDADSPIYYCNFEAIQKIIM